MPEPICFTPDLSDINGSIRILSFGVVMAVALLIYSIFNSKLIPKFKQLFQLASAMGFMICLGLLVFSLWSKSHLKPLCLDEENITIGKEIYSYNSIQNVQIYLDQQGEKMVQIGAPEQYQLLIIEIDKQQIVFSEHHYPVMDIYTEIQLRMKKDN